jgi:hypothetical protein
MRNLGILALVAAVSFTGVYGLLKSDVVHAAFTSTSCNIKGNISYNGGQRIYHVPGQHYYDETVINPMKGERWFCTEAEARAAGWRRAGY